MIRVYVAGPISKGNVMHNVYNAVVIGDLLMARGFAPFVPHVMCLWDMISPHDYKEWTTWDNEWLKQCQAVYRMPGESPGADQECKLAEIVGIPIFYSIDELVKWEKTSLPSK